MMRRDHFASSLYGLYKNTGNDLLCVPIANHHRDHSGYFFRINSVFRNLAIVFFDASPLDH